MTPVLDISTSALDISALDISTRGNASYSVK